MSDELDTIVAADNDKYMIRCENLVKIYKTSDVEVVALQGLGCRAWRTHGDRRKLRKW